MNQSPNQGIVLMNLGSPDSCSVADVRKYLMEFLMDERVIDYPYLFRTALVKGIIGPFRSPKSAEAYHKIWTNEGSPLVVITKLLKAELEKLTDMPIEVAMRYGSPSMKNAFDAILNNHPNIEQVILLPLYPHYAMSSYETAVVHAEEVYKQNNYPFKIRTIPPFYDNADYISALSNSIQPYLSADKFLLFSYHSVPERHILKGDTTKNHCLKVEGCCEKKSDAWTHCYRHQCITTTKLVAKNLGLSEDKYAISFQSKLGNAKWLTPSTTQKMTELPAAGIKNLAVVCPAFVIDCLETLEEVAVQEKENFLKTGGENFTFIPCLNTQKQWVETVLKWVQ